MRTLLAASVAVFALAGCTASTTASAPSTSTITVTHTQTKPPAPFTPIPAATVAPLPPGQSPPKGEVEKACPYIASTPDENPNVNVADIEGDHVYRTTVLTRFKPVGCRFYFYAGAYEAIADIVPQTFATALDAHNALVATAGKGKTEQAIHDLIPGVDAILYQTLFFGPDGPNDWACAFAKGKVLVIVHTQQAAGLSFSAKELAAALAPKF